MQHARARSGRRALATMEPLLPDRRRTSAGLSPAPGAGPAVLLGDLIRFMTGASWVDIEAILDHQVSDTTLRARRDEWIAAGVFDTLEAEALARSIGSSGSISRRRARRIAPQGALRGEGNRPEPHRSGEVRLEVVRRRRNATASRSAGRSTAPTATTCACSNPPSTPSPTRACSSTSTPCISITATTPGACATDSPAGAHRARHPATRHQSSRRHEAAGPARAALDRRSHQHVVVELRATPTQHRPSTTPPPRRLCLATITLIVGRLIAYRDRWSPT